MAGRAGTNGGAGVTSGGHLPAVRILAIVVAFRPGLRSTAQVAALAAAVVIASQLAVDHWFYLYIPWFCGLVFAALALPSSHTMQANDLGETSV